MRILAKEEAKFIDQWAVEKGGLPLAVLMENAGRGVAEAIVGAFEEIESPLEIVIVAGKGNNGADGLVAARQLEEWVMKFVLLSPMMIVMLQNFLTNRWRLLMLWKFRF